MKKYLNFAFFSACLFGSTAKADVYIGLDDIERALTNGETLRSLLADKLGEDFNGINLTVSENDIEFSQSLPNYEVGDCDGFITGHAELKNIEAGFDLDKSTSVQLREANIEDDITLNLNISGELKVAGDLSVKGGVLCNSLARDSAALDYRWSVSGDIEAKVKFVQQLSGSVLALTPHIDLTNNTKVSLTRSDLDSDNALSALELFEVWGTVITSMLMPEVNNRISVEIENIERKINNDMETFVVDIGSASSLTSTQLASLDRGISNIFSTSLPLEYIASHREELLAILLSDDISDATDLAEVGLFQEGVACELIYNALTVPLKNDDPSISSNAFYETRFSEFCAHYADSNLLGNGKTITAAQSQKWTLNPALKIDWGVSSIIGNSQPFMQRKVYKTIGSGSSSCSLEMRIYKKNISDRGLKPLMMLHGGGWFQRGVSFLSMESQISHYTDAGFVVFAPFYRLTGSSDGPSECNQVTGEQITQDVASAFEYVVNQRNFYGAENGKVALLGQSAGAHLATWLSVNNSYKHLIDKVVGYYGIYDFKHVAENVEPLAPQNNSADYPGADANSFGTKAMVGFLGMTPTQIQNNPQHAAIVENTFTDIIASNPSLYPDYFLIHGRRDSLIPPIQSARMCDAVGGTQNYSWDQPGEIFTTGIAGTSCNSRNSFLFFIEDASHGLDICPRGIACDAIHSNAATREQNVTQTALVQKKSIAWLQGKPVSPLSLDTLKPDLTVMPWYQSDFDVISAKIRRSVFGQAQCLLTLESDALPLRYYEAMLPANRVGGAIDGLPVHHSMLDGRYNVVYDCGISKSQSDFTIEMTNSGCPKGAYRKVIDTHAVNFENLDGRKYDSGCTYVARNLTNWSLIEATNTKFVRKKSVSIASPRGTITVKSGATQYLQKAQKTDQWSQYHSGGSRSCYIDYRVTKEEFDPLTGARISNSSTIKTYRYQYLTWKWYQKKKYCPSTNISLDLNKIAW